MVLIGALLLCHGILGFAHQDSCHGGCEAAELVHSSTSAHDSGHADGQEEEYGSGGAPHAGQVPGGYFAVVLALFGAVLLGLLLGVRARRRTEVLRPYRSCALPAFALLPRGPTPPLLQVFRL